MTVGYGPDTAWTGKFAVSVPIGEVEAFLKGEASPPELLHDAMPVEAVLLNRQGQVVGRGQVRQVSVQVDAMRGTEMRVDLYVEPPF